MADPLGMGQHRDAAPRTHVLHELLPASGDDQVHALLEGEHRVHLGPVVQQLHRVRGKARLLERIAHHVHQRVVGLRSLAPALQEDGVPRAERQRGDLHQRVRARLEDDGEHTERTADLLEHEPLVELPPGENRAKRILPRCKLSRSVGESLELRRVQLQPLHQRRCQPGRRGQVAGVGLQDPRAHPGVGQVGREQLESPRARRGRSPGQASSGLDRTLDPLGHRAHVPITRLSRVTSASSSDGSEKDLDLVAVPAGSPAGPGVVVDEPSPAHPARPVTDLHHVALANRPRPPPRRWAGASARHPQRRQRSGVDHQRPRARAATAMCRQRARRPSAGGRRASPRRLREDPTEHVGRRARGDDRGHPGPAGEPCRLQLAGHPPGAAGADSVEPRRLGVGHVDAPGTGSFADRRCTGRRRRSGGSGGPRPPRSRPGR